MWKVIVLCCLWISCNVVIAGESPACHDQAYDYSALDANGLRQIAASCEQQAVSDLFYHRAYYADLITEAEYMSRLIPYTGERDDLAETYFMYMALVEEFAKVWYPDSEERVLFLISEYQRQNELVELRLHGFDHLADRLQQQMVRR